MEDIAKTMTDNILKSLRNENAPERAIIEAYLSIMVYKLKKEGVEEYLKINQKNLHK